MIARSLCDSAAKFTTKSGRNSSYTAVIAAESEMSAARNSTASPNWARLSRFEANPR